MNQPMVESEFIQAESERIHLMEKLQACSIRDWQEVVADLVGLYQQAFELQAMSKDVTVSIQKLVQSLREQG